MSQSQQLSFVVKLICFARGNARITSRLLFDSRWFLIQLVLFLFRFFQMNQRDNEWDGELLISQKEPEKHWSVESQEAFFKLSLTNTQRAPLKPPHSKAPEAPYGTEPHGDEKCVNHTQFPDTSSLQTSPPPTVYLHASPSDDLLEVSASLYHVKYSRLLNSGDLHGLLLFTCLDAPANYVCMFVLDFVNGYFDSINPDKKKICKYFSGLISLANS